MKIKSILASAFALVAVFASCNKEVDPVEPAALQLSKTTYTVANTGGQATVNVASNIEWTATPSESWLTLDVTSGKGNGTVRVNIAANTGAERTGKVVFAGGDLNATFTVTQEEYVEIKPVMIGSTGFDSIMEAVAAAAAGDVITVADGTYKENVKIAAGKEVTIKGASKAGTIIAGDVEVMGKLTVKDATIQSEDGVTKKDFLAGDDFNAWWGYIVRAGAGSTVNLENVKIYANPNYAGDTEACQYITAFFAAQANVTIKDCDFALESGKLFAPTQFFSCTLKITGTTFTTTETISPSCEEYVLKIASANNTVEVANNTFNSKVAIFLPNDGSWNAKGTLKLGDGVADNNTYGANMEKAIRFDGAKSALEITITPEDVVLNQPYTQTEVPPFENPYALTSVVSLSASQLSGLGIDMANVRNTAFDGENFYFGHTTSNPFAVDLTTKVTAMAWDASWTAGYTGRLTGLRTVVNGNHSSLLVANACGIGNQWANENLEFDVYFYDTPTATPSKVLTYTLSAAGRMGDYIDFYGTWQKGSIIVVNSSECNVYEFDVTDGTVNATPRVIPFTSTSTSTDVLASIYKVADDLYIYSRQSTESEIFQLSGGSLSSVATFENMKSPRVFTYDGKKFIAYKRVMSDQANAATFVKVVPVENGIVEALTTDLNPDAVTTFQIDAAAAIGNYFSTLDVVVKSDGAYIGTHNRSNSADLLKFAKK